MNATFIRAAEVWLPSDDGSLLDFGSGAFGAARRFAAVSRQMCFGRGEGLPGRAWDEGRPILLRRFEGANFRRTDAAHAAGLTCAVALPLFLNDRLRAVAVLYAGHRPGAVSALELWHGDTRVSSDMRLVDGAYGEGAQAFEEASRDTWLPRGVGLPGLAWQRGETVFLENLPAESRRFLRAEAAAGCGLLRALALPASSKLEDSHAVVWLADAALPLALRVERWVGEPARGVLRRSFAFSELHGGASQADAAVPLNAAASALVRAWRDTVPVVNDHPADEPGAPAAAARNCGAQGLLALPVAWQGEVAEVLVLYF